MKKILLVFILIFAGLFSGYAVSPQSQFSLITVSPGDDLYNTFGHSAIRFYDRASGVDKIYNYGTFDFNAPGFYLNFTRGKLDYMLSVSSFHNLLRGAQYENRSVLEQVLNLEYKDKVELYKFLETNYLPENRFYKYDFFFDNCSTRIRDALMAVCGDRLKYNYDPGTYKSFRQLIDEFLTEKQFQDLGMDIGLGSPADQKATAFDYMFLPEYLFDSFNEATIELDGDARPLVKEVLTHFEATPQETGFLMSPNMVMWGLFLIVILMSVRKINSSSILTAGDVILFGFTGFIGLILLLLWFATDHAVTAYNWDLVWAMPLNLLVAVLMFRKKRLKPLSNYLIIYSLGLVILLAGLPFIPQEINPAVIPFILVLLTRSLTIAFRIKKPMPGLI
jgi:hypothetical protein